MLQPQIVAIKSETAEENEVLGIRKELTDAEFCNQRNEAIEQSFGRDLMSPGHCKTGNKIR
jgi:hypothetical protein